MPMELADNSKLEVLQKPENYHTADTGFICD